MLRDKLFLLWTDQRGVVVSAELIVISTVLVLGLLVGLTSLRDQVVQEFADISAAIGSLDQSYSFADDADMECMVAGSSFTDESDFCDEGDTAGAAAQAITFEAADMEDDM